jgi:hypothetical protein
VYLVRDGVHPTIHGNEHYYRCPNGPKGLCSFTLGHYKATDALLNVLPEVKRRTTDVVTRIYDWAAGGNSIRLQQSIDAKRHRRQWIHENQIEPCKVAGVKPDPDAIIEHARLAEEISQLERELEALGAQTELMQRAAEVLSAFGGNIEGAMPLLNEDGQAIVWRALLAEVHMTGTGHGRARQVWVHSLRTAGEHFVKPIHYPEENGSGASPGLIRVMPGAMAWLAELSAALRFA